jgi:hypothetical protein
MSDDRGGFATSSSTASAGAAHRTAHYRHWTRLVLSTGIISHRRTAAMEDNREQFIDAYRQGIPDAPRVP